MPNGNFFFLFFIFFIPVTFGTAAFSSAFSHLETAMQHYYYTKETHTHTAVLFGRRGQSTLIPKEEPKSVYQRKVFGMLLLLLLLVPRSFLTFRSSCDFLFLSFSFFFFPAVEQRAKPSDSFTQVVRSKECFSERVSRKGFFAFNRKLEPLLTGWSGDPDISINSA